MHEQHAKLSLPPTPASKPNDRSRPAWPPDSAIRVSRARLLGLMRRRQPGDWVAL